MDEALPSMTLPIPYNTSISANGFMYLSPRDMNSPSAQFPDNTVFYRDQWFPPNYKGTYGTLAELNQNERFKEKIIVFGAYDNNLSDNLGYDNLIDALLGWDHDKLQIATLLLAGFNVNNKTRDGVTFYANDGLVPLQSALFLDISEGTTFSKHDLGIVTVDEPEIKKHKQVKRQYFFTDDIRDHFHLLDTDNASYWALLASEIRSLLSEHGVFYVSKDGLCNGNKPCFPMVQNGIGNTSAGAEIYITQETYDENIVLGFSELVALRGGWDTTFTSKSSYTTINGSLAITNGTIIVENILVK
jgi:hypothetical protein